MLSSDEYDFLVRFHRAIRRTLQTTEGASVHKIEMSLRNYELCKQILASAGPARWWRYSPELELLSKHRPDLCVLYELNDNQIYVILN